MSRSHGFSIGSRLSFFVCSAVVLMAHSSLTIAVSAEDWAQFRGPAGSSVASNVTLPTTWDEAKNTAWKVELPGKGPSSPIVVGDQVIVTGSSGYQQKRLHVASYDAKTGKKNWHRQYWATGRTSTHPFSAVAAPTPASDGQRIYAFYSSNDLICLDLEGNLQWFRGLAYDYPKAGNDVGMSSSPLVVDGVVVVQIEAQGDSFAAGIDATNGETLWRIDRDQRANWASPTAVPLASGKSLVLLQSPNQGISARVPKTGEEVWKYEAQCGGVPSPLVLKDSILLSSNGLTKVALDGSAVEFSWDASNLRPGSASPVVYSDKIYVVNSGVLKCGDLESGKKNWEIRIGGKYWATPVIAGGLMYVFNQDGEAKVIKLDGKKGEIVGESEFSEGIKASPAVGAGAMFVRSDKHLWKISE